MTRLTPTATVAPELQPVSPLTSSAAFVGRSLRQSLRDGEGIIMAIALPVMLMVLFTYVFGGALAGDTATYLTYVVPGVMILCATQGSSSVATAVSRDLTQGVMNRFRTMPIVASTVLVGHIVASAVRNCVAMIVVMGVALLLGYRPAAEPLQFVGAFLVLAAFILMMSAIMATIGIVAGSPEAASGYGIVFFVLPYLSSGFVPIDTLSGFLQPIARHQPFTYAIEALRGMLDGTGAAAGTWLGFALWTAGFIVLCAVIATLAFPRSVRR